MTPNPSPEDADVAAVRALYERVEMDESVGMCLSSRVEALNFPAALDRLTARLQEAERERDEARGALEHIRDADWKWTTAGAREVARAALEKT